MSGGTGEDETAGDGDDAFIDCECIRAALSLGFVGDEDGASIVIASLALWPPAAPLVCMSSSRLCRSAALRFYF